jgi:hypothetical protein
MNRREALQTLLGGVFGGSLFPFGLSWNDDPILNVTCNYVGTINGQRLDGKGLGEIDAAGRQPHNVTVRYSVLPTGFHPFAVGASFVTIGIEGARRHGEALNLWDLSHGNYGFERQVRWPKFPSSAVHIKATVVTRGEDFRLLASYAGKYEGPTDLSTVHLWESIMTQAGDDVTEVGRGVIGRRSGETFEVLWDAVYRGFLRTMAIPRQHASMTAEIVTFSQNVMYLRWTADVRETIPRHMLRMLPAIPTE